MLIEIFEFRLNFGAVLANDPVLSTFVQVVLLHPLKVLFVLAFNPFLLGPIGFRLLGEGGIDENDYKVTERGRISDEYMERCRICKKE
jgi:hypothetical protein